MTYYMAFKLAACAAFGWYLGKGIYTAVIGICLGVCKWLARG